VADSPSGGGGDATLFGHPTGLFTLFFAEMWERFSYYGMRALLVFYMIKGFLNYGDGQAYTVYGAYTALIYMTPFFGGLLADKLLGPRIAVVLGGILMAAGHLLMTIESEWPFFFALALLITGNGFFKPNISTMVGMLYPKSSGLKDSGFTIFYMGINLGAAMSPLLCGYIGETYGWHYGFGLATIGMLVGLAVFVMPNLITQLLIFSAAIVSAIGLFYFHSDNVAATAINVLVGAALIAAGIIACIALSRGGLPRNVGRPPNDHASFGSIAAVCLGTAVMVPIFALLVSGMSPFTEDGQSVQLIASSTIEDLTSGGGATAQIAGTLLEEVSKPAGLVLTIIGVFAFGYLLVETFRLDRIWRHRMIVALVLIFFQMLFFAFFEQAGSSINNFTDRNIDRVNQATNVTDDMVGQTIRLQPTQEQLGYTNGDVVFTISVLDDLRQENENQPFFEIDWEVSDDDVGMGIAQRNDELPASIFQSVNPGFILVFGLIFTALWGFLKSRNLDPSAPVKFGLGLAQLGLGFGAFWMGAEAANDRGMVSVAWLLLGYMFQTTGELCLSPVGLSTMTKLSPRHLVSTVMGGWFLATAFSQYLAAIISQFTGVTEGSGAENLIPIPSETVGVYGGVFGQIAIAALISGGACLLLSPLLTIWMHQNEPDSE
jgi:POT family proton-dependent oligopeptide transporter